jgi:glycosyltransferase involved in cell wall biosynthesis
MRTALVSNSRLVDLAGSEITTMEVAGALASLGMSVIIAAYEFGDSYAEEIRARGYTLLNLREDQAVEVNVDVAWIHHATTFYSLVVGNRLRAKITIVSSLSYFEPMESPPFEMSAINRFLVNSAESHEHFVAQYPEYASRCEVFPNAAPPEFWDAFLDKPPRELTSVAVVSNHRIEEVDGLGEMLRKDGINVDVYGIGAKAVRVTPELLLQYDAVVTIGKTVQYCLAAGVPVFCYDHFAGPGWITDATFDAARHANFSGRSHPSSRTAGLLYTEFKDGFEEAFVQRVALRDRARELFDLSRNVRALLDTIPAITPSDAAPNLTSTDRNLALRHVDMLLKSRDITANVFAFGKQAERRRDRTQNRLDEAVAELSRTRQERDGARAEIDALKMEQQANKDEFQRMKWALEELSSTCERSNGQLNAVYNSTSWRLTKPVRAVKSSVANTRARVAWGKFLVQRGIFVARHQGVGELQRKATRYVRAVWRNKMTVARSRAQIGAAAAGAQEEKDRLLVSFVIPIYDRTDVLRQAIQSALAQTVGAIEVILVTDGSPQPTLDVVNEFASHPKVRVFHFPVSSGNAVRGRNKGILEARGRYIAFLDSDDVAAPDRIEKSLPLLESGKADVVYGAWRAHLDGTRDVDGIVDGQVVFSPDADLELLKEVCVPCQSTVTVRRSKLLEAGFLKPYMEYREDHELWARLAHFGAVFRSLQTVLVDLRLHQGNNELNFKENEALYASRLREQYTLAGPKPKKIAFILPGVGISGGVAVVLRHAAMLMKAGHDVTIINAGLAGDAAWFKGNIAPIVHISDRRSYLFDNIDMLIATGWQTAEWLERMPAKRHLYFVQSDERRFYDDNALKEKIGETYRLPCEYFTEAHWIRAMLRNEFGKPSAYVPNGLDPQIFKPDTPLEPKKAGRLRVLLEGPIVIPFKGMADAYAAVESLDCDIWIVSSAGKPLPHWRYDRFFEAVQMDEMRHIYSSCDIFIKMSRVEGFFGPPMEAMACGCAVVIGKVTGWDEYIVNEGNALVAEQADVAGARQAVKRLLEDDELRHRLIEQGKRTAAEWTWERSGQAMLEVVETPVTSATTASV